VSRMTGAKEVSKTAHRPWHLARHMISGSTVLLPLAVFALALGMAIYHWVEKLSWADAFLNSAMLLGGMGPVDRLQTTAGKWLAGLYALFAGVVFLVLSGVMLAPVLHHVLQRFHVEGDAGDR
jgi:predicted Kef-type K+ transport protein